MMLKVRASANMKKTYERKKGSEMTLAESELKGGQMNTTICRAFEVL